MNISPFFFTGLFTGRFHNLLIEGWNNPWKHPVPAGHPSNMSPFWSFATPSPRNGLKKMIINLLFVMFFVRPFEKANLAEDLGFWLSLFGNTNFLSYLRCWKTRRLPNTLGLEKKPGTPKKKPTKKAFLETRDHVENERAKEWFPPGSKNLVGTSMKNSSTIFKNQLWLQLWSTMVIIEGYSDVQEWISYFHATSSGHD